MIVCSWNINSIRMRENLLLELINSLNPDVIFLQEIKCQDNEFPSLYKEKNYNLVINGEKGKYGVAILIKKKIEFEEINFESDIFKCEARICGIKIKNNLNLHLINIYAPNGNPIESKDKFSYKIKWYGELHKVIKKLINSKINLILAGDFNVLEHQDDVQDFDKWQNDALGHISSRKKFREILFSGLTNIVRLFYKPGEIYSFWDYQRASWERNYGLLIDHFLLSPKLSCLVESIFFEKEYRGKQKPSDHIPLWIKLST